MNNDSTIDDSQIYNIINSYFKRKEILVNHQIESYNDFIDNILPNILSQFFPLSLDFNNDSEISNITLVIKKINIEKPYYTENNGCSKIMDPNIARLRNYTYSISVLLDLDIAITINSGDSKVILPNKLLPNILLGKIPIIVKSKYCTSLHQKNNECIYDNGGYSIINGNEKILITQEKIISNSIQTFKNPKAISKYSYICEIRSINEKLFTIPKTVSIRITNKVNIYDNIIKISIPHLKQDIPVFVIFKALGCVSDKDIIYHIIDNNKSKIDETMIKILRLSLEETKDITTEIDALQYISKYVTNYYSSDNVKTSYICSILDKEYLPHLKDDKVKKIYFTGLMVNKLLKCYLKIDSPCDRDSYCNKRLETCGTLMGNLTYQCIMRIVRAIKIYITKEVSTGVWNINKNYYTVSHMCNSLGFKAIQIELSSIFRERLVLEKILFKDFSKVLLETYSKYYNKKIKYTKKSSINKKKTSINKKKSKNKSKI